MFIDPDDLSLRAEARHEAHVEGLNNHLAQQDALFALWDDEAQYFANQRRSSGN